MAAVPLDDHGHGPRGRGNRLPNTVDQRRVARPGTLQRIARGHRQIDNRTSIVNIWQGNPTTAAEAYLRIAARFPGGFLLGLGVGHREQNGATSPMAALNRYLDVLDLHGVPVAARVLAALGPKTLELAHQRAGGVVHTL